MGFPEPPDSLLLTTSVRPSSIEPWGFLSPLRSFESLPHDVVKIIQTFASTQPCQGRLLRHQQITAPGRSSIIFKSFHESKIIYMLAFDGRVNSPGRQELVIEDLGDPGESEFQKNRPIHVPLASDHCFFALFSGKIFIGNQHSQVIEIWDVNHQSEQPPRLLRQWSLDFPIDYMFRMKFFADRVYLVTRDNPCIRVFSTAGEPLFAFGDCVNTNVDDGSKYRLGDRHFFECSAGCLILTDRKQDHKLYDHNGFYICKLKFDPETFPLFPMNGCGTPSFDGQLKLLLVASPSLNEFYYPNRQRCGSIYRFTVYNFIHNENVCSFVKSREFSFDSHFGKDFMVGLPLFPIYLHCLPSGKICLAVHGFSHQQCLKCFFFE